MLLPRLLLIASVAIVMSIDCNAARAQDPAQPLSARIDELISARAIGPVAPDVDDAQFLRRISLDLIGRIPSVSEVREFLGDGSPDKRERAVDRLLSSPEFPRHMAVVFDVMLMERRGNKHVKTDEFREYLRASFEQNKPYDQLVREILSADGTEDKIRAAAAFYLERDVEPNLLTREIGRTFFGIDLQCAQCHDHPLIDDYVQTDYYGLNAFVMRSSLFQPDTKKPALVAEKAEGESTFKSVFTEREDLMGPRLPGGQEFTEAALMPGERYDVKPDKNVRGIPKVSRLARLAEAATDGSNVAFNLNIANRLWAHMFGRGLVQPVDLHHSSNPPSHPEVLELVAREFAGMDYDVRGLLRELALTRAYQRSYVLPDDHNVPLEDLRRQVETVAATAQENWQQALDVDERIAQAITDLDAAIAEAKPLREAVSKANDAVAAAVKKRDEAAAKLNASQTALSNKKSQADLVSGAVDATNKALEALKDDQELTAALTTLKAKLDGLTAETGKLQATTNAEQQALDAEEAKVQETHAPADTALAALQPADEEVRQLRAAFLQARTESKQSQLRATVADKRVEYLQQLIDYRTQAERLVELRDSLPALQQQIEQAQQMQVAAQGVHEEQQTALAEATRQRDAAIRSLQQAQAGSAEIAHTASLITSSLTNAEQALARLKSGEELDEAIGKLKQTAAAVQQDLTQAKEQVAARQETLGEQAKHFEVAKEAVRAAEATLAARAAALQQAEQKLITTRNEIESTEQTRVGAWESLLEQSARTFNVAAVTALTAEQLGWSVLYASGHVERQRAAEQAKLDKESPLSEEDRQDPVKVAARRQQIDQATTAALEKNVARFVQLFASEKGQPQYDFFATAEQALFFANGGEVRSWLSPAGDNLTGRLAKMESGPEIATELYLSFMTRYPSPDEQQDVTEYLQSRGDEKSAALQELAWALMTSAEFRFRH